jgi:hypothetical protein
VITIEIEDSSWPYLGVIFGLSQDDLGCHVDGGAHASFGAGILLMFGVAEIADLQQRPSAVPAVPANMSKSLELKSPSVHDSLLVSWNSES